MESLSEKTSPRFLIVGQLRQDFLVLPTGEILSDMPGGNLLYAGTGLAVWEPSPPPGLVGRVGEDYPQDWLAETSRRGFNTRGVRVLSQAIDLRSFMAYIDGSTLPNDDPVAHFASQGQQLPKDLLGYQSKSSLIDSRTHLTQVSIRQSDFPAEYLEATAAHICPLEFLTHSLLPAVLRQAGFTLVTLDPSPGYMNPTFRNDMVSLIKGLTAFLPSEEEMRSLFKGISQDLWEMAEALAAFGCEVVLIKRGERGQLLYDAGSRTRWEIPAYPARMVDPTGAGDAFCGGFVAGYRRTYEPLQAALHGNISASLVVEGSGPFYALEALPGLAQARLEALRQSVRKA